MGKLPASTTIGRVVAGRICGVRIAASGGLREGALIILVKESGELGGVACKGGCDYVGETGTGESNAGVLSAGSDSARRWVPVGEEDIEINICGIGRGEVGDVLAVLIGNDRCASAYVEVFARCDGGSTGDVRLHDFAQLGEGSATIP